MERFLKHHADQILGVLHGFDRVLYRGSLRCLSYQDGFEAFLASHHVLYKDFAAFSKKQSDQLKEHAEQLARQAGRPCQYVASPSASKEDIAREIIEKDHLTEGLVCVLTCVELCYSYQVQKDAVKKHIDVKPAERKCLHLYFYYLDREYGLMHVRLQTWLPFTVQVCVNGHSWLARQLDRRKIGYATHDNCFTRIDDLPQAQQLMDQLTKPPTAFLTMLGRRVNPLLKKLKLWGYYWSIRNGEYSTDVMFKDRVMLTQLYPHLLHHAVEQFRSAEVMRFLGRRLSWQFQNECTTHLNERTEGVRIKHWVDENSIKMYDKGSVLRVETTINNPRRFKVRRMMTQKSGQREIRWLPMRKGIVDQPRWVEFCRSANARYLEALAVVSEPKPVATVLDPVSVRRVKDGRPYRPLRPVSKEDAAVFELLLDGRFLLKGFRNQDLRTALWPHDEKDDEKRRRASGRSNRLLRLLRAHHLIGKVPNTRYYRVSPLGQSVMTTALQLRSTDLALLAA